MFKDVDTQCGQNKIKTCDLSHLFSCAILYFLCTVNTVNQEIKTHKSTLLPSAAILLNRSVKNKIKLNVIKLLKQNTFFNTFKLF